MLSRQLSEDMKAGLYALYRCCNGSTKSHVPAAFWRRKFLDPYREVARRTIKKLRRHPDGLVWMHKGHKDTFGITLVGIRALEELGMIGVANRE